MKKSIGRIISYSNRTFKPSYFLNHEIPETEILDGILEWIDESDEEFDIDSFVPIIFRKELSLSNLLDEESRKMYESRSRWDFEKNQKIVYSIIENTEEFKSITSTSQFLKNRICTDTELLSFHEQEYLDYIYSVSGFCKTYSLGSSIKNHLSENPDLHSLFLEALKYRTGGTILAGEVSLISGVGIMLGGGNHHSSKFKASGWCAVGDIQLCLRNLQRKYDLQKIMILDLDCHQSNGITKDIHDGFLGDEVFLVDVFNKDIWPYRQPIRKKNKNKKSIPKANISVECSSGISDTEYLRNVELGISEGLEKFNEIPECLFYVAGSDILKGDKYGMFNISPEGLIRRDQIVFQKFYEELGIPVIVTTAGGYKEGSWRVVVESLKNLQRKFRILDR